MENMNCKGVAVLEVRSSYFACIPISPLFSTGTHCYNGSREIKNCVLVFSRVTDRFRQEGWRTEEAVRCGSEKRVSLKEGNKVKKKRNRRCEETEYQTPSLSLSQFCVFCWRQRSAVA